MRLVVDTNILVSFAIKPSPDFEALFDYIAAQGVCLVSDDTLAELFDVLSRPKFRRYIPLAKTLDFVEWYAATSEQVVITQHVVACRDPRDDKFLSLAMAGNANYIVAGDRDLLDMGIFSGIGIYRATEFLRLFVK